MASMQSFLTIAPRSPWLASVECTKIEGVPVDDNVAEILDNHCDLVLVGDSLGSVLYNYKSTREVTLETMINHSISVRSGVKQSLMVVDMPYNTYRNPSEALKNSKLVMKETKCDAVKLEGGKKIIPIVEKLVQNKIPVMGHVGICLLYTSDAADE